MARDERLCGFACFITRLILCAALIVAPLVLMFYEGAKRYERYADTHDWQWAVITDIKKYGEPSMIAGFDERICRSAMCATVRVDSRRSCYLDYAKLVDIVLGDGLHVAGPLVEVREGQPMCIQDSARRRIDYDGGIVLMIFAVALLPTLGFALCAVIMCVRHPSRPQSYAWIKSVADEETRKDIERHHRAMRESLSD